MSSDAPVIPLTMMMTGLYLVWFGVKYWEDTKTVWPSDPVKDVLQGKGLPPRTEDVSASGLLTSAQSQIASESESAAGTPIAANQGGGSAAVPAGVSGSLISQAKTLLARHKWNANQLPALASLWNKESGWNPKARNPSSGAFGVAQALGHGVPGGAAPDGTNEYGGYGLSPAQARAANSGNGYWQMVWGLNYIASTYGSPQAAWQHEQAHNWY